MGGIVGFVDASMSEVDLDRAIDAMHHRGPDGRGVFISETSNVGLGCVELSIMDPTGPEQPFFAKEGELVLVCNGELYGFEPIRDQLVQRGHSFYTRSDSEVILHLYMEYGLKFVEHLRGEFSFLLFDKINNVLLAVRDHLGIRPLFYSETDTGYLFASEAKALFSTGKVTPKIDVAAVQCMLEGNNQETIFDKVLSVPAGHILSIDINSGEQSLACYWDTESTDIASNEKKSVKEYVKIVQSEFESAVQVRLRSDVPMGVYLCGQATSAITAKSMAKYRRSQLKAFNVTYPDDSGYDNSSVAKKIAVDIGANFHSIACDHHALLTNMEDCLWSTEQPISSLHTVGQFLLSRFASKHVKVVMTNDGTNDTLSEFLFSETGKVATRTNSGRKKAPMLNRIYSIFSCVKKTGLVASTKCDGNSSYGLLRNSFFPTLSSRQEIAHSIEGRPPFLDVRLIEKIKQIPSNIRREVLSKAFSSDSGTVFLNARQRSKVLPALKIKPGENMLLDGFFDTYLAKDAIERSGIFIYDNVQSLLKNLSNPLLNRLTRKKISQQVILILTTQILDHLYVRAFHENLVGRCKRFGNGNGASCLTSMNEHQASVA